MDWKAELAFIEQAGGPTPRAVGWFGRFRHAINKPTFPFEASKFAKIYWSRTRVHREGTPIWGVILKANASLWERGGNDSLAEVAFSPDLAMRDDVDSLALAVEAIDELRSDLTPSAELADFHRFVNDDYGASNCRAVPASLSGGHNIVLSTLMVYRGDLPAGRLVSRIVPLLYHEASKQVAVAPGRFWSLDEIERLTDEEQF